MTPAGFVLDTGVVVALAAKTAVGRAVDERHGLRLRPDKPLISIVSVGECLAIARRNKWGEKRLSTLHDQLASLAVVELGQTGVVDAYASIWATTRAAGTPMGQQNDVWVAALASVTGYLLLTTDADFEPLEPDFLRHERFDPDTGTLVHGQ